MNDGGEKHGSEQPPSSSSVPLNEDDNTAASTLAEDIKTDKGFVTWDGPDDRNNPMNFPHWRKVLTTGIIILISLNMYVTTFYDVYHIEMKLLCSNMGASAPSTTTGVIAVEFNVSDEVTLLITSLYVVGYIIGPILWSGLSEVIGRRPVLVSTLLLYTLFNLGPALARNAATILVTRFFAGLFASAPLTLGGGAMADIWAPVPRGTAVVLFSAAVFAGPIMGPIFSSFIVASFLGWRWVFWIMMIFSGFCWIICFVLLPETFAPVLLQKKVRYSNHCIAYDYLIRTSTGTAT